MSTASNDQLLAAIREAMVGHGLNSAAVAKRIGQERKQVRRALGGQEEMSLSMFLQLTEALGIEPSSLPWGSATLPPAEEERSLSKASEDLQLDPYGIQGEQAFRLGFSLGIDFMFVAETGQLAKSGIPQKVLEGWPEEIVLKLDAAYHRHNEPRFTPEGVGLKLSFDDLYDCFLPWSAIGKVVFHLETPEPATDGDEPDQNGTGPRLRLVKG